MKRVKKFSNLLNESFTEKLNEGLADDVIKKLGYKNLKEIQKQKNLLMKLESIAKEISKKDKENTKNISEEGDDLDLDLDLDLDTDTEETPKEEEPKEEEPKEETPKEEEPKEEKPKEEKSKKILSFDEFVADKTSESIQESVNEGKNRPYSIEEIVEKYKDVGEKLEGHAKKMKEEGASNKEIKDMHPEVSDEDLKEELSKADVKKMVDDETKGLEKKIKKAEDKAEKAEDKAEKAEDTAEDAEKEADKAEKEASKGDDIKSDKEFEEYGMDILKQAHPDDFDEATAKKVIDGLIKKYKGDYGAMVGALTSGFGG